PAIEHPRPAHNIDRTMRDRGAGAAHEFEIARQRVVEIGIVSDEIAVADIERRPQQAKIVEKFYRGLHVLAHGVVKFEYTIGGVRRYRQFAFVGSLAGTPQQLYARCLDLTRHQNATHPALRRTVVLLYPLKRRLQSAQTHLVVADALEPARLV